MHYLHLGQILFILYISYIYLISYISYNLISATSYLAVKADVSTFAKVSELNSLCQISPPSGLLLFKAEIFLFTYIIFLIPTIFLLEISDTLCLGSNLCWRTLGDVLWSTGATGEIFSGAAWNLVFSAPGQREWGLSKPFTRGMAQCFLRWILLIRQIQSQD